MLGTVPPTAQERAHYYDGLLSKPLLVARTSTTPFPPVPPALTPLERENRAFPYVTVWQPGSVLKSLGPIGGVSETGETEEAHKIVRVWCPALREALVSALDQSPLASCWSALYTLRVTSKWRSAPDRVQPTSEVVLFVGIDVSAASSIPRWEDGQQAALACRAILRAWDVQEVEVEVLTNSLVGLDDSSQSSSEEASTSGVSDNGTNLEALVDFQYETVSALTKFDILLQHESGDDFTHAFLDYPGQRLEMTLPTANGNRPSGAWGSLGLYVGLGGPDVYALTSRHVAIGARLPSDQRVTRDDHIPLLWGTRESLRAYATTLRRRAATVQLDIETLSRKWARLTEKRTDGDVDEEADRLETEMAERAKYANDYLFRMAGALEALASHAPTTGSTASLPSQRLLGSAAYSAPHGRTKHGAWNDWALVRLTEDRRRLVQGHDHVNSVLIGRVLIDDRSIRPSPRSLVGLTDKDFLSLQEPVVSDASDASDAASPLAVRHPRWVGKRGAMTGLTFGLTGELEAVFRRPLADGTFVVAYALLVLDHHRSGAHAFSRPGDTGSAVFDMEGRVVGLVDAGVGAGGQPTTSTMRPDIALVTPMEWVFDAIEEETGTRPVLL